MAGHKHLTTMAVVLKLGAIYQEQGKFKEVEDLYRTALRSQGKESKKLSKGDDNDAALYFQRMSIVY